MTRPHTYLVFPPGIETIGGAEKRFAGLWYRTGLEGDSNLTLVGRAPLFERLRAGDEFAKFDTLRHRTVTLESPSRAAYGLTLARLRATDRRAIFHFINEPPTPLIPVLAKSRTAFSLTAASVTNYSRKGLAVSIFGCLNSGAIDFLDDDLAEMFRRWLPFRRQDITTTPGSFIDLDFFKAPPAAQKKNNLVFLGTFLERKQTFRLLETLPAVQAALTARGHRNLAFSFLGRDSNEGAPLEERAKAARQTVDIRIFFADRPSDALSEAKVFFSLQKLENYPSKALLEAMACGALPIVTDVGKSRLIARDDFAQFVPQDFTAEDIIRGCDAILSFSPEAFDQKVAAARAFMAKSFSFEAMSSYYQSMYERLAARADT